jgi:hypothetical protein
VRYLRKVEGKMKETKSLIKQKMGFEIIPLKLDGRISTVEMVWAHCKNTGREIPQNDLTNYNTKEETRKRAPRHLGKKAAQNILKESGIEWKGSKNYSSRR